MSALAGGPGSARARPPRRAGPRLQAVPPRGHVHERKRGGRYTGADTKFARNEQTVLPATVSKGKVWGLLGITRTLLGTDRNQLYTIKFNKILAMESPGKVVGKS